VPESPVRDAQGQGADTAPPALPATVIGGWLGAGKTTLVNHLLRHAGGRRIAVLVNDFGEVSIDAELIEGADGGVLSLAGGCMCCSWGEDLFGTIARLRARPSAPDLLLVETSGVAQPATVARLLRLAPGLDVEGVVVLVDAETVRERAADRYVGELVRQQLAEADLLVLNKTDLAPEAGRAELHAWLAAQAPRAAVVEAEHGRVAPAVVLGLDAARAEPGAALAKPPASGGDGGIDGSAEGRPLRAFSAAQRFESGSRRHDGPVDVSALAAELTAPGSRIVRAKGVLTGLDGRPVLLQVVGRRAEIGPAPANPGGGHPGLLVWIALRAPGTASGSG
jgi:G3E family GTPase